MLGLVVFASEGAYATSCRSELVPIEERAKNADVIFIGKFQYHVENGQVDPKSAPLGATRATVLKVKKVFKGNPGKEVTIFYKKSHPGCALDYFSLFNFGGEKKDLLIFAKEKNGKIYTNEKMGSGFANVSNKDKKYLSSLK
jgi:hypothetical protein